MLVDRAKSLYLQLLRSHHWRAFNLSWNLSCSHVTWSLFSFSGTAFRINMCANFNCQLITKKINAYFTPFSHCAFYSDNDIKKIKRWHQLALLVPKTLSICSYDLPVTLLLLIIDIDFRITHLSWHVLIANRSDRFHLCATAPAVGLCLKLSARNQEQEAHHQVGLGETRAA